MATNSQPISYFFEVQGMVPQARYDNRRDSQDRWLPPKKQSSNVAYDVPGQNAKLMFYYNGTSTYLLNNRRLNEQELAALNRAEPYKTYSIYHARSVFWTVDYDASQTKVGDGKHENDEEDSDEDTDSEDDSDEDDSSDDGGPYGDDWAELSFRAANVDGNPSLSYAGRHESGRRLLAQQPGQDWVHHLIPDRYHARATGAGGLVGDLPLLIGLAAMSLPVSRWADILPQIIVNPPNSSRSWRIPAAQRNNVARGSQWFERRGVVVRVFRDPQVVSRQYLGQYEQGIWGPILA